MRVADAVNERLDLGILLNGLGPVPGIGVLGCVFLELIGGAVVDVLVDALARLAPEEVGVLVVFAAPAGEASGEGDFGNEPELYSVSISNELDKEEGLILLHLGGVSDGFELRVSGASHCGAVMGVSLAYGKGEGVCRTLASRGK